MKKSVVIIGAGGHGKVVADVILKNGDSIRGFLDDDDKLPPRFMGYPLLGKVKEYPAFLKDEFIVAVGNADVREQIVEKMKEARWYTAVHPAAVISGIDTEIGEGTVVMANAVVNAGTKIGRHCIVNSSAVAEHDNLIEDFSHISVGAKLAGNVHIGKKTWIGIGAVVNNNLEVAENCMIGAGAVVIRNIERTGTYVGVPAAIVEMKDRENKRTEILRGGAKRNVTLAGSDNILCLDLFVKERLSA